MKNKKIQRKQVERLDKSWANQIAPHLLSNNRNRIFYAIIVLALGVFVLIISMLFLYHLKVFALNSVTSHLSETTALTRDNIDANLQSELQHLNHLAVELAAAPSLDEVQTKEILLADTRRHSYYHRIGVVNTSGDVFYTDSTRENVMDKSFFPQILQGLSGVCLDQHEDNEYLLQYYRPILNEDKILGGILVEADISHLTYYTILTSIQENAHSFVVFPSDKYIVKPQAEGESAEGSYRSLSILLQDYQIDSLNEESSLSRSMVEGVSYYISYEPISYVDNGYVVSIISERNIFEDATTLCIFALILVLTILLLGCLVYLYVYKIKKDSYKTFEFLSYTDALTGYSSWPKFEIDVDYLMRQQKDTQSSSSHYYFIYTNIEKFKLINDIHGFEVGNKLLCHIGYVLSQQLESDEPFTRSNADRYTLLMHCKNDYELINRLEIINAKIMQFSKTNEIGIAITTKFGIYKVSDHSRPISAMSDRALLALQNITHDASVYYGFYSSSIRQKALMEKELENDMYAALKNREFTLYLQPKFDLSSNQIVGAEALVRWIHPRRGLIAPSVFISLFEKNGFIIELDNYMFEESCKLLSRWRMNGIPTIPISVNISKAHLYNPNLSETLYNLTVKYNVPPELLEIELTESMDYENLPALLNIVNRLKSFRFPISIDDFGTGYSSLNLLKDLPVDVLKIDREFFAEAADEKRGRDIIISIIDMVKRLDMKTVAEGVERQEQVEFLMNAKCDFVQGFYFSQPIPVVEFENKYLLHSPRE